MLNLLAALASLALIQDLDHGHHGHHAAPEETQTVARSTTFGDVRTVDAEARTAVIRHGAMSELGMSAMVMSFHIAENVDITLFEPGAALTLTVINGEQGLEVIAAEPEAEAGHAH